MSKLFAIFFISLGSVSSVYADNASNTLCQLLSLIGLCTPGGHSGPVAAPDIDPASAISAVALLVGGLAVLRGRSLKKK